jgi:SAM-dependent methyltransferase
MTKNPSFDEEYYRQFYQQADSRVESEMEIASRGAFVCAYLKFLRQPVRSVLDLGCGLGQWQPIIQEHFPTATYQGVEVSEYLCDSYGWEQSSIEKYRSRKKYDLVICQDVLQYLPAPAAARVIKNFHRLCRGALYLQVLTKTDWDRNCDQERTDGNVYKRSGEWYRQSLSTHFTNVGGGVFVSERSNIVLYELESAYVL